MPKSFSLPILPYLQMRIRYIKCISNENATIFILKKGL